MVLGQLTSEMFIATIQAKFQVSFINPFHVTSSSIEVFLMAQTTFSCLRGQFSGYSLWVLLFKSMWKVWHRYLMWVCCASFSAKWKCHMKTSNFKNRKSQMTGKEGDFEGLCLLLLFKNYIRGVWLSASQRIQPSLDIGELILKYNLKYNLPRFYYFPVTFNLRSDSSRVTLLCS